MGLALSWPVVTAWRARPKRAFSCQSTPAKCQAAFDSAQPDLRSQILNCELARASGTLASAAKQHAAGLVSPWMMTEPGVMQLTLRPGAPSSPPLPL